MIESEYQDLLKFLNESKAVIHKGKPVGKTPVIKNDRARMTSQSAVRIPINHAKGPDQPIVDPILEKGLIVGIRFTCSCHRTTEIRFDYDDALGQNSDNFNHGK